MSKQKLKIQTGITLIALIITIIVMLILVGVTVTVALNGGLFSKAKRATTETEIANEKEILLAEAFAAYDAATGMIDEGKLKTNLEAAGWTVETENGQTVYISPNNKKYTTNEKFEVAYVGDIVEESVTALEDDNNPLTIGSIEDLVDLAIAVNEGTTYEGETITLLTSLDFDNPESYRTEDPQTTIYTDTDGDQIDINGDGTAEPIMTELTTGLGFMPIGIIIGTDALTKMPIANSFGGTFAGNGKTLNNLYINRPEGSAALFGEVSSKATIQDLTIENPEVYGIYASGLAISCGFPEGFSEEDLPNCINDILTIENCHTKGGKIGAVNKNCISQISSGLLISPISLGKIDIKESSNRSIISGFSSTGLANLEQSFGKITIAECNNYADIVIEDTDTYKAGLGDDSYAVTAGCVIAASSEGVTLIQCSNYGNLTEMGSSISGIVVGGGASVLDCFNYGTLNVLTSSRYIYVAGVYLDFGFDIASGIEGDVEKSNNYGDINISTKNNEVLSAAGISNGVNNVSECINKGNITFSGDLHGNSNNEWLVAGINVGDAYNVYNCINHGNLTIDEQDGYCIEKYVSGISIGENKVINCVNYGNLDSNYVAGIAYAYNKYKNIETQIYNCYNFGDMKSSDCNDAGFGANASGIGTNAIIKNCYNLGEIIGKVTETNNIIGNASTITNCYNLTGNETAEEKQALLEALNANRETDAETPWSEWKIDPNINNGYPVFSWQQAEE